jgi:hypothetical protein
MTITVTTKVIPITKLPTLSNPVMVSGVPTEARARAWGIKNNFPVIYYYKRMGRVYAEKKVRDDMERVVTAAHPATEEVQPKMKAVKKP